MASVNTLRLILVGGAVFAAIVAAVQGRWVVMAVMVVAVVVHGGLTLLQRRWAVRPQVPTQRP